MHAVAALSLIISASSDTETPDSVVACSKNEAYVMVKLAASEISKGAGWTLIDSNGAEILGETDGKYGKRGTRTSSPYAYFTCISK
eukprot:6502373-Ditylum_brightwellii.AAC.1